MSELRFNELRGEEVDYAIHRQERTFLPARDHCPLCPTRAGAPATEIPFPAFEIAVFDNRFPAFEAPQARPRWSSTPTTTTLLVRHAPGAARGGSDVGLAPSIRGARARARTSTTCSSSRTAASRSASPCTTPHGQIYGYPFLPPVPALELAADERMGGCAPCLLMQGELEDGRRILCGRTRAAVAYVPYAGAVGLRSARDGCASTGPACSTASPEELRLLAVALQKLVRGYDALFDRPFPLRDGHASGADERPGPFRRRSHSRGISTSSSIRHSRGGEAQVPRWIGAGSRHVHLRHAARGVGRRGCARRSARAA